MNNPKPLPLPKFSHGSLVSRVKRKTQIKLEVKRKFPTKLTRCHKLVVNSSEGTIWIYNGKVEHSTLVKTKIEGNKLKTKLSKQILV